jgi:predicted glycosyltransferase
MEAAVERLLMYSQDGMGLGHLRRSSNIAQEVLSRNPGCDVLVVADSPATSLFSYQPGLDCLKLPTVVKTDATSWESGSLSLEARRLIKLREKAILEAFREFKPDTVLVDHMPVGALGELKPMLDCAAQQRRPPRMFLGLRDVLDDPGVIRHVWHRLDAYDYLRLYDSVLVYGSDRIYDASTAYRLPDGARSVTYCGYVSPRSIPTVSEPCLDTEFLLMMGGGGRDAFPLASAFVDAFPKLSHEFGMPGVLLTGPSMSEADREHLCARAGPELHIESALGDAAGWVKRAAAVVTMAGYNSLCEVLKWRRKALVVPRVGPSAEQRMRSRLFSERFLIRALPPRPPKPDELVGALTELIAEDEVPQPANIPPLDGAERSAEVLLEWRPKARRVPRMREPIFHRPLPRPALRARRHESDVRILNGNGSGERAMSDLPLLGAALDRGGMSARLGELLAPSRRNGWAPRLASLDLLAYRPGRRALLVYDVDLPARGERVRLFGKHFADVAHAKRVRETLVSLHAKRRNGGFAVPSPLDWIPELALVLYVPARGLSLGEAIRARSGGRFVRLAAASLADLHTSGPSLDRRFRLADELRNLASWANFVAAAQPTQEGAALEVLEQLRDRGPELDFELDAPIHKDLHHEHLVLDSKLSLLDVDEMRFGDPSFDLAHFCTYLKLLAYRGNGFRSVADKFERFFLEEYSRRTGWSCDERFTYFRAYTCLKIAKQLCRGEGVTPRPAGLLQQRQVHAILAHGQNLVRTLR